MMALLGDAGAALREIFTPAFRWVAVKILGITLAMLVVAVVALHRWLTGLVAPPYPWLAVLLSVLEGLGLGLGSIFLVAPASALVAGFFVDDLAAMVERDVDPLGTPGTPLKVGVAISLSVRFALLSLCVMVLALALLFVPGLNAIAFLGANAYLSGRQYFEFAALRHRPLDAATRLRQDNAGAIAAAGLLIALFLSVPVLNLLTPLFGTALMVRVYKRLDPRSAAP